MAKESFQYRETEPLFKTLEEISQRSGVSRGRSFEDVIRASVAALAAETMEAEYFEAIASHKEGTIGNRSVDLFPKFFGQTVDAISQHNHDVLGDLFQSAISYQENAFFMTPQPISTMLATMMIGDAEDDRTKNPTVHDPCCGTGILLIEAGQRNPDAELCGQDIDSRCADIAGINLGLRSHYGWIVCGNSLSREVKYVYRVGHFYHESDNGLRRGVIRKVDPRLCPVLPELHDTASKELFGEKDKKPSEEEAVVSTKIIEVPRWALRLEQLQLPESSQQSDSQSEKLIEPIAETSSEVDNSNPDDKDQLRLF